ncbi:uncharacterized protein LOC119690238 [Teleopsis dalmanni]|uniref:uncharacterized protein LOC119690238 n=1 Tax=Teleopsis dalmanni TaxID=139649 RepID=UPI0018CDBA3A|nr:uncharacterized protein LOC119690238 [Teleopsis dalmanni]
MVWSFGKIDLSCTPSVKDGVSIETEKRYRKEGARFISDCGMRLKIGHNTIATAVVMYHRFYLKHSHRMFPRFFTACACIMLSGKVEETPKKCRDIIATAEFLLPPVYISTFGSWPEKDIIVLEKILLQTIHFDFDTEHPYKFLIQYAKGIKGDKAVIQDIVQMAWNFINDSYGIILCIEWEPEIIAVALLNLACELSKFSVTDWCNKTPTQEYWWDVYIAGISIDELRGLAKEVLDIYELPEKKDISTITELKNTQSPNGGNANVAKTVDVSNECHDEPNNELEDVSYKTLIEEFVEYENELKLRNLTTRKENILPVPSVFTEDKESMCQHKSNLIEDGNKAFQLGSITEKLSANSAASNAKALTRTAEMSKTDAVLTSDSVFPSLKTNNIGTFKPFIIKTAELNKSGEAPISKSYLSSFNRLNSSSCATTSKNVSLDQVIANEPANRASITYRTKNEPTFIKSFTSSNSSENGQWSSVINSHSTQLQTQMNTAKVQTKLFALDSDKIENNGKRKLEDNSKNKEITKKAATATSISPVITVKESESMSKTKDVFGNYSLISMPISTKDNKKKIQFSKALTDKFNYLINKSVNNATSTINDDLNKQCNMETIVNVSECHNMNTSTNALQRLVEELPQSSNVTAVSVPKDPEDELLYPTYSKQSIDYSNVFTNNNTQSLTSTCEPHQAAMQSTLQIHVNQTKESTNNINYASLTSTCESTQAAMQSTLQIHGNQTKESANDMNYANNMNPVDSYNIQLETRDLKIESPANQMQVISTTTSNDTEMDTGIRSMPYASSYECNMDIMQTILYNVLYPPPPPPLPPLSQDTPQPSVLSESQQSLLLNSEISQTLEPKLLNEIPMFSDISQPSLSVDTYQPSLPYDVSTRPLLTPPSVSTQTSLTKNVPGSQILSSPSVSTQPAMLPANLPTSSHITADELYMQLLSFYQAQWFNSLHAITEDMPVTQLNDFIRGAPITDNDMSQSNMYYDPSTNQEWAPFYTEPAYLSALQTYAEQMSSNINSNSNSNS